MSNNRNEQRIAELKESEKNQNDLIKRLKRNISLRFLR